VHILSSVFIFMLTEKLCMARERDEKYN